MDKKLQPLEERKLSSPSIVDLVSGMVHCIARLACVIVALDMYFDRYDVVGFIILIGIALGEITILEVLNKVNSGPSK